MAGHLKPTKPHQKGLNKLPKAVRNKMGYMNIGGVTKAETSAKGKKSVMDEKKNGRAKAKGKGKALLIIGMKNGGMAKKKKK